MPEHIPFPQLREQAIALRRAGKSREIKELLGITSNQTLNDALRGEPPQPGMWRPNAKDDLRVKARELRQEGLAYHEIVAELGVSKSTVSAWVSDMPRPERLSYEQCCRRQAAAVARYWAVERQVREAGREAIRDAAAAEIGALGDREIIIAGSVAYWCEGVKNKPYRRHDRVNFINSDPILVKFFLRFLDVAGIDRQRLIFRVYIHENADAAAAQRFWLEATQAHPAQFRCPTLKRHNPRTIRKNTGDDYHGCLRIDVRRSAEFYRKIEGWASAAMSGLGGAGEASTSPRQKADPRMLLTSRPRGEPEPGSGSRYR
jgi:transcriptional regulator with XRE-family HTH domain